jgi:hypothetical protein
VHLVPRRDHVPHHLRIPRPAESNCRETSEMRSCWSKLPEEESWEGRGARNLDGAGGVAETVAGQVEGEDQATRRRWPAVAARHCRRIGRELWIQVRWGASAVASVV